MPITSRNQKLSKIETLRLARNYISALGTIIARNESIEPRQMANTLSRGLSQGTSNLIAGFLQLTPRASVTFSNGQGQLSSETSETTSNNKLGAHAFFEPNELLREYTLRHNPNPPTPSSSREMLPFSYYNDMNQLQGTHNDTFCPVPTPSSDSSSSNEYHRNFVNCYPSTCRPLPYEINFGFNNQP